MAEGDCTVANNWKELLWLGTHNATTDTFKVALSTATITADGATLGYSDISAQEISGSGYTAGGTALTSLAVSQDDTNNWGKWDAADATWTALAAATITSAWVYDDTLAGDPIVCAFEIATNSNGGDYTLAFGSNGIITLG